MRIRNILCIVFFISILVFSGCNAVENVTVSGSKLILQTITGKDLEGNDGSTTIFSDVITLGSVFNDNGVASLTALLIDPLIPPEDATYYQNIMVDQIDVEYSRSDGQNVEGVDIPYSFSQKVSIIVEIGADVELPFVLVNHNAKLEPPLIGLVNLGQSKILKLEAKVTIHGKDLSGNRVEPVIGYASVWCANFADAES